MTMQEHYPQEDNEHLSLAGNHPLMNTYPYEKVLIDSRYFTGKYRVDSLQGDLMNIGFYKGQEPDIYKGELVEWSYYDDTHNVYVVDKVVLFVKGLEIMLFIVQLQQKTEDE